MDELSKQLPYDWGLAMEEGRILLAILVWNLATVTLAWRGCERREFKWLDPSMKIQITLKMGAGGSESQVLLSEPA